MSTGAGQTGSAALEAFAQRREVIAGDIAKLEKQVRVNAWRQPQEPRKGPAELNFSCSRASRLQIYELESIYFTADCTNFGNVVKVRAQPWASLRRASPLAPLRPLCSHHPTLSSQRTQGFSEFLTSKSAQAKNKNRQFRLEDRVFSLSSITSPGVRRRAAGHAAGDCSCSWRAHPA
jgi:hypothetical protein